MTMTSRLDVVKNDRVDSELGKRMECRIEHGGRDCLQVQKLHEARKSKVVPGTSTELVVGVWMK